MDKYLLIFLFACNPGTKTFYVSNDTWKEDFDPFMDAALSINAHLQCNLIIVYFANLTMTPNDYGRSYNFVSFTSNPETFEYLQHSSTKEKKNIVGQTLISLPISYARRAETDILLTTVVNGPKGYDARLAYIVALHELGHALGLPHSEEPADIMAESVPREWWLGVSDFQWIRFTNSLKERGFKCP